MQQEVARPAAGRTFDPARTARVATAGCARFLRLYLRSGTSVHAAALSFNLLVACFPILTGFLVLTGQLVSSQPGLDSEVRRALAGIFPSGLRRDVIGALQTAGHSTALGLLSVAGLAWFSTGLFSTLGYSLNRVFGTPDRSVLHQRLRGLRLGVVILGGLLVSVGVNAFLFHLRQTGGWPRIGLEVLGGVAGWAGAAMVILWIYRNAPSRTLPFWCVAPAAAGAGFGVVATTRLLPLYLRLVGDSATLGPAIWLLLALAVWLYLTAQLVLGGGVLAMTLSRRAGEPG